MNVPPPAKLSRFNPRGILRAVNSLIDCAHASAIVQSPGIISNRMPRGTTIKVVDGSLGRGRSLDDLPYMPVVPDGDGGNSGGVPLNTSAWMFGYGVATGASVPVTRGWLYPGIPKYAYAGGNVTVTGTGWIGWQWSGSTVTVTFVESALDSVPSDFVDVDPPASPQFAGLLHGWSLVNNVATPQIIAHLGYLKHIGNYAVKP